MENVNWYDAAAFANAVSDAAGLAPCYLNCAKGSANDCQPAGSQYDCEGYWIPTESEWKYAAGAGEEAAFPSGGNLWKWVYDQFDAYEGDQTDPVGPDWNGDPVMRGAGRTFRGACAWPSVFTEKGPAIGATTLDSDSPGRVPDYPSEVVAFSSWAWVSPFCAASQQPWQVTFSPPW